jgi:hypothetical protein
MGANAATITTQAIPANRLLDAISDPPHDADRNRPEAGEKPPEGVSDQIMAPLQKRSVDRAKKKEGCSGCVCMWSAALCFGPAPTIFRLRAIDFLGLLTPVE